MVNKQKFGLIGLITVVFFWGAGFPAIKYASESFTPLYQIALRFLIATIVLAALFYKKLKLIDKKLFIKGAKLSVFLFIVYFASVTGMQYTSASKASFYCCLSVIIVPFFAKLILKATIQRKTYLCIIICTIGLYLVAFSGDSTFNRGDFLCIMCSFAFAAQIVLTEKYIEDTDTSLLTIVQMFCVSIIGFIIAIIFDDLPSSVTSRSVFSLVFMGVFCTAFAFWMQTTCQRFTSSTEIAIVFTLEPIFGAVMSYLLLDDALGAKGVIGGIFIIISLLLSELDINKLLSKNIESQD